MRRTMVAAAMILLAGGIAPASRLCRDTKGLFTPCTGERPPAAPPRRHRGDDPPTGSAVADRPDTGRRHAGRPDAKPPLVARSRLCRDTKGLFTPCPR